MTKHNTSANSTHNPITCTVTKVSIFVSKSEKRNLIEKKTIWLGKYFFLIDLYEFMYFYLRIFFFFSKENPSNSREADIYTESKIKTVMKTF